MPLILAKVVNELNASPLDTATRLRTYDEIVVALKQRIKDLNK